MRTTFQYKNSKANSTFCNSLHPKWEFSHIGLPVKKIYDLRMHFLDLIRNEKMTNWSIQCQKVLQKRHAPLCQHLLKKGPVRMPSLIVTTTFSTTYDFVSQVRLRRSIGVLSGHMFLEVMLNNM